MFAVDKGPKIAETDEQQRVRFQVELEFVQCLANPNYLNCKSCPSAPQIELYIVIVIVIAGQRSEFECDCRLFLILSLNLQIDLAQNGHLKNKAFINYLNYLQYWKKPEYAKYLK